MKKLSFIALAMFLSLLGVDAQAASAFDALTAGVDLTAISSAMTTVFSGMIVVGIFLKGGTIIANKLGWK